MRLAQPTPVRPIRSPASEPNYTDLDRPTVQRVQRAVGEAVATTGAATAEEMLDIPAFLRRQAD